MSGNMNFLHKNSNDSKSGGGSRTGSRNVPRGGAPGGGGGFGRPPTGIAGNGGGSSEQFFRQGRDSFNLSEAGSTPSTSFRQDGKDNTEVSI